MRHASTKRNGPPSALLRLVFLSTVLLALGVEARTKAKPKRPVAKKAAVTRVRPVVAILPFSGPLGDRARAYTALGLKKRPELGLIPTPQTDQALRLLGPGTGVDADFQNAGRTLDATALVQGAVSANRKVLTLRVYTAETGKPLGDVNIPIKQGKVKNVAPLVWVKLRPLLLRTRQAPKEGTGPTPTPTPPPTTAGLPEPRPTTGAKTDAKTDATTSVASGPERSSDRSTSTSSDASSTTAVSETLEPKPDANRPLILDATLGGGVLNRSLRYKDDIFKSLAFYDLLAAPSAAIGLEFYPLAFVSKGALSGIGIVGGYQQALGLKSENTVTHEVYKTTESAYNVGLRYRLAFGPSEVGVSARYGAQRFGFGSTASAPSGPSVPDVAYTSVRLGVDGRLVLGPVAVLAGAGYLPVLTSGEISSAAYFPHLKVSGVEAMLGVGVHVAGPFEVRLVGEYRRYFYAMNPVPGDARVAGGAVDQFITGTLQGALRFQ